MTLDEAFREQERQMKLTDKEILEAWESAFDKPISFYHKPTADDILLIRIKAVLVAEEKKSSPSRG